MKSRDYKCLACGHKFQANPEWEIGGRHVCPACRLWAAYPIFKKPKHKITSEDIWGERK